MAEAHLAQLMGITAHLLEMVFGHFFSENLDLLFNDLIKFLGWGLDLPFVNLFATQVALVASFSADEVMICRQDRLVFNYWYSSHSEPRILLRNLLFGRLRKSQAGRNCLAQHLLLVNNLLRWFILLGLSQRFESLFSLNFWLGRIHWGCMVRCFHLSVRLETMAPILRDLRLFIWRLCCADLGECLSKLW